MAKSCLLLIMGLLCVVLSSASALAQEAKEQIEIVSIQEMGHETKTLSRNLPLAEYWFEIPGNWRLTQSGEFVFNYSHPQTTAESRAVVKVELNGQIVHEELLGQEAVEQGEIVVPLVLSDESPQGLHLIVRYQPRGGEEGCFAPDPRPFILQESSTFRVAYQVRPAASDLALLPYPFAYARGRSPIRSTFVISAGATEAHYEAAARLTAWWGRVASNTPLAPVVLRPEEIGQKQLLRRNLVVLGQDAYSELEEEVLSALHDCKAIEEGEVALCAAQKTHRRADAAALILNVEGDTLPTVVKELEKGGPEWRGRSLSTNSLRPSSEATENFWLKKEISFHELDLSDVAFRGLGESERTFYIRRPRGWQLGPNSQVSLHFSNAGPTKETKIRTAVNGVELPLANIPKDLDGSGRVTLAFPEDARLNRNDDGGAADYLVMQVRVEHSIENPKEEDCDPRQGLMSTTLHDDSSFRLHPESPQLPDLAWFPYPFSDPRGGPPTLFLLPPDPSIEQLTALIGVTGELGRGMVLPPEEFLISATKAVPQGAEHAHLVIVGEPDSLWNQWVHHKTELTQQLPSIPVSTEFGSPVGQIAEFASPLNQALQLLVVQASKEQLGLTAFALKDADLSGGRMVVDHRGHAVPVEFGSAAAIIKKKTQKVISESLSAMEFGVLHVLLVILLLTNISFAFLWSLARKRIAKVKEQNVQSHHTT